jgi:Tol biopolymer transport system component
VTAPDRSGIRSRWREADGDTAVWLLDTSRGAFRQFTSGGGFPVWSPEGSRLLFSASGGLDLYVKPFTGAGREELLLDTAQLKAAADWSRDGRYVLYRSVESQTGNDLFALSLDDRRSVPVVQTAFDEREAQFSPDGRWIAFVSNE